MLAAALALLLLPNVSAVGTFDAGPYAGVLVQDQSATHHYDNDALDQPCVSLARPYTVAIQFAPADAFVQLDAHGHSGTFTGGSGSLSFWSGVCTAFDIVVSARIADPAVAYTVEVLPQAATGVGGGLGGIIA